MKFKTTQKAINNAYRKVIRIGYCELQDLLRFESPDAYTCGVYGWNADIYTFGNVAIVTGYRPFGNIRPAYDQIKLFEERAREIMNNQHNYDNPRGILSELIRDFIGEATA